MKRWIRLIGVFVLGWFLFPAHGLAANLVIRSNGPTTELALLGQGAFHSTEAAVTDARLIEVPGSALLVALWNEHAPGGPPVPHYAFSFDGQTFAFARETSYEILLPPAEFDPLQGVPPVPPSFRADPSGQLFIVQFVTQPLEEFRQEIRRLGGTMYGFLPNNAHVVKMDEATGSQVQALPYVRWVGPYHPPYRLEGFLRENLDQGGVLFPLQLYNIVVFENTVEQRTVVAQRIEQMGGKIEVLPTDGFVLIAWLTPLQLVSAIRWDEVCFVDRWTPAGVDMNLARDQTISGASYVERIAGYTGAGGVRGEVMDTNLDTEPGTLHPAFRSIPPVVHGPKAGSTSHGTNVYGCVFGDGTGVDINHQGAKGIAPQAQGIFADYCRLLENAPLLECINDNIPIGQKLSRSAHTAELVDPTGTYKAVFQSNSWGNSPLMHDYTSVSQTMDDILFQYDLLICQAQANAGSYLSRPQAWAKNIVSVGGVWHNNTVTKTDDQWFRIGQSMNPSTGPAADGRIKPDFTHFFDKVYTTVPGGGYLEYDITGTSGATPITCGHLGLFFKMWADRIFGNQVLDPNCNPASENCVFKNRPHMTTAKAMMINTASAYPFVGSAETVDLTRTHQGWGLVQAGRLHILRSRFPVLVDETRVLDLTPGNDTAVYTVTVPTNVYALRATLVYTDPPGNPNVQTKHAVNDLTLKVTAPNGTTVYWGNCGLREGNWSIAASPTVCTAGDHPFLNNPSTVVIDTVENVFVQAPVVVGTWTVRVIAEEIVADAHPETPGVNDVDFALVVSIDPDCNQNGSSDADDILRLVGPSPDCNNNSVPDSCDIASGTSPDCEHNGIPDECEYGACCLGTTCTITTQSCCLSQGGTFGGAGTTCTGPDCNCNTIPDSCDIASWTSPDSNENGVPDECESPRACCLPDDSCVVISACSCAQAGGTVLSQQTFCETTYRACCRPPPYEDCVVTTAPCCYAVGGTFMELILTCGFGTCPSYNGPSLVP